MERSTERWKINCFQEWKKNKNTIDPAGGSSAITSPVGEDRKATQEDGINRRAPKKNFDDTGNRSARDRREEIKKIITVNGKALGAQSLCQAFGMSRSTFYRAPKLKVALEIRPSHHRGLSLEEESSVLEALNSERFRDMAPPEIYATMLDEGLYLCAERTMYRILERNHQSVQRRQSEPRQYARPELLASRPNEVWSWDITKLKGPRKWTYYYLYTILDIYSRYVVGWMVAYRESATLAEELIAETCKRQKIERGSLTVHADNGSSMKSLAVAQLLADLGVTKTHSRPHVSNDNPFSESAFKTLKYRPDFPERFLSIEVARSFCQDFYCWYNHEHRHAGIAMLTPISVHYQQHEPILKARAAILSTAFEKHPERFVKGMPKVKSISEHVYINPPLKLAV
jgi:putative transposase